MRNSALRAAPEVKNCMIGSLLLPGNVTALNAKPTYAVATFGLACTPVALYTLNAILEVWVVVGFILKAYEPVFCPEETMLAGEVTPGYPS
jgi:hypothetical protein